MSMTKIINNLNWRIGGEAGLGILNAGTVFAKTLSRAGLYTISVPEYPSLIRGGHNFLNVRVSDRQITSHRRNADLLVALNTETIERHHMSLSKGAAIIYDDDDLNVQTILGNRKDILLINIPLKQIAKEVGNLILQNTIAIAASFSLLDFPQDTFLDILKETFQRKGESIVAMNHEAAKRGYAFVKEHYPQSEDFGFTLEAQERHDNILITGNKALAIGAVQAGCKLMAAYPMTPATSVMTIMAKLEKEYDLIVKHTEDELAAINMAIGGNYAGVRSMCATSGGGFALMAEGLGLAAVTETPLVIIEAMRPGPGTGMATHTGQGDLRFIMHAGTDEFPRIVMTPGDVDECFYGIQEAFNLSEEYQVPVIVLTDKFLGESTYSVPSFDLKKVKVSRGKLMTKKEVEKAKGYSRYKIGKDPISPRAIPGMPNCIHVASSYEHNEKGTEEEDEENRIKMHDRRFKKMELIAKALPVPKLVGLRDPDHIIIGWGSTKGIIRQSIRDLAKEGIRVAHLHLPYVNPLPSKAIEDVFNSNARTTIIENNKTRILAGIIKEQTGKDADHHINKYDGRPFFPEEIVKGIKKHN